MYAVNPRPVMRTFSVRFFCALYYLNLMVGKCSELIKGFGCANGKWHFIMKLGFYTCLYVARFVETSMALPVDGVSFQKT